jgi:hypothetical protein
MTLTRKVSCYVLVLLALSLAGCARKDQQVAADVQTKINADGSFPDKQLNVTASNGVVTLAGTVSSETARQAAAKDAAQVDGVKTVVNNLQVAQPLQANLETPAAPQPAAVTPPPRAKPSPRINSYRASRESSALPQGDNNDVTVRTRVPSASSGQNPDSQNASDNPAASAPAPAPAPTPAPVAPPPQPVTVPSGTQLSIRLNGELNSETAQVGDVFHGSISTPILIGDATVIPTTADVEGRVVDVKSAGRFAGKSDLVLELTRLIVHGKSYSIATDQWSKAGNARGKSTATKVGGGAAVGAILGGIFGGGKGAAIGAAAGGGAGTGVSAATKGQQIILKPETVLNFQLQNSIAVAPQPASRPSLSENQN